MTKLSVVPLVVALFASTAFAEGRSARLLGDAPKLLMGTSLRVLDVAVGAMDEDCHCGEVRTNYGVLFAKTSAVGIAASATGVLVGAGLGSLSNNLIGAILPGALIGNLLLPPVLTVLAAMLMGNWDAPGRFSFWLPVLGAFVGNAAVYVIVSLALQMAVAWTNPVSLMVYAVVQGFVMGGATTGIMALTEKKKSGDEHASVIKSFVPGITDTTFVSLGKVDL
jgi:hypothetical protein